MDFAVKLLIFLCAVQSVLLILGSWFYSNQIHKLLDKLMSRDFHSYHSSIAPPKKEAIKIPTEVPEDLRVLQGFQIP